MHDGQGIVVQRSIKKKWSKAQTANIDGEPDGKKLDELDSDLRAESSPIRGGRMTPRVPYDKNNNSIDKEGGGFSNRLERFEQDNNTPADLNR